MKYSIQTLNKISKAGTDRFCDAYTISDDARIRTQFWFAVHRCTIPRSGIT